MKRNSRSFLFWFKLSKFQIISKGLSLYLGLNESDAVKQASSLDNLFVTIESPFTLPFNLGKS